MSCLLFAFRAPIAKPVSPNKALHSDGAKRPLDANNNVGDNNEQILLDRILEFNLAMSTVIFYWAAKIYLMPKLKEISATTIFVPILILHSLRHLGLMFMASGAVYEGMPTQFAYPAAIGDFIAALLALFGLICN